MPWDLDPNHPGVQRAAATVSQILWDYAATHTMEECLELSRLAAEDRVRIQRMFDPQPILMYERLQEAIKRFGLAAVLPYDLDDPC